MSVFILFQNWGSVDLECFIAIDNCLSFYKKINCAYAFPNYLHYAAF
jgi:hypothetical protein